LTRIPNTRLVFALAAIPIEERHNVAALFGQAFTGASIHAEIKLQTKRNLTIKSPTTRRRKKEGCGS